MTDSHTADLIHQLADQMRKRKCETMPAMLERSLENNTADTEVARLLETPYFAHLQQNARKHNASQDSLQELVSMVDFYINEPVPDAIGEMLVRRMDFTSNETKQIPIIEPAKAAGTARGKPSRGRGSRRRYVKVQPDMELESHESWDYNHVEDADWDVASMEAQELSAELDRKTSKAIIDKLDDIPVAQTNGKALYAASTPGTWTFDDMVDMKAAMKNAYVTPRVLVMNYDQSADLLKSEIFQDSRRYGDFTNKAEGFIGMALGMDIYETNEVESGHLFMLDPMKTLAFGVRRYKMMDSYDGHDEDGKKTYGMCISTKYTLQTMSGQFYKRCENA